MSEPAAVEAFSEKGFYLAEFRGRTLAIAAPAENLAPAGPLMEVLAELAANDTRTILLSDRSDVLEKMAGAAGLPARTPRLEAEVWRGLAERPCVGIEIEAGAAFAARCSEVATRLGVMKLVWIDAAGGLRRDVEGGEGRRSFVALDELQRLLSARAVGENDGRRNLLVEIEAALRGGLPALNVCSLEGLASELFTYAGSGTLFTRERYVSVRRLGIDDYNAAAHLIARGIEEGYLAPRSQDAVDGVLASALGAFVEGVHLAGIGALIEHHEDGAAEIASLYTLTRFIGEGVGGDLVAAAIARASDRGFAYVFACTTSERVVNFFARNGFRRASEAEVPAAKWAAYDEARRAHVMCVRCDLR